MLELLAAAGILEAAGDGFVVLVGADEPLPAGMPADPIAFADEIAPKHGQGGATEIELFRRCGGALREVLVGDADPLTLLFGSGEPSAGDLYKLAPAARAANRMLGDAVAELMHDLPEDRKLRVIEVGAGTGSGTGVVLPELPEGRYDYTYTDISAGFFSEAEALFGGSEASIDYRPLDIERSPVEQGFDAHGYDLVIASNVLHATRFLKETLGHCIDLLAPSGHLVALEGLRIQGWMDLTFGQLDGWWRYEDDFRPNHALVSPELWKQSLGVVGFVGAEVLGPDGTTRPDRGIIVAQGPEEILEPAGAWILAADEGGVAARLADELEAHNQTVVLAGAEVVEAGSRESWKGAGRGVAGGRAAERRRPPDGARWARSGINDRGVAVGRDALDGERPGARAGPRGRGRDAGAGRVVPHARRAGAGTGARRGADGLAAVGSGQGGRAGGAPAAAAHDRPRPRDGDLPGRRR